MPDILVFGSVNRDLVVHAPRLPLPGETLRGTRFASSLGGKGANQAAAATRLGAAVALVASVGAQEHGDLLVAQMQREGIDCRWVLQAPGEVPGTALIVVGAEDGENMIVTVAGSNATLPLSQVEAVPMSGVRWVVAQLELPLPVVHRAFERAKAAGARTLLNAAPMRPHVADLLPGLDVLVVNANEALQLLGLPTQAAMRPEAALAVARRLRALGPAAVLVSLGGQGLVWVDANLSLHLPAQPVTAVDTVGAGDTLVGALLTALAEGQAVPDALRFAQAAAGLAVSRPGVQDAMPRRAELDAVLAAAP